MLIEGGPGTGKTVLASTICYANAVNGKPCLYVSLREQWEYYKEEMMGLGMDFEELLLLGLFKYVRMPVLVGMNTLSSIVKVIMEYVPRIKPRVIVIDGITPITDQPALSIHKARSVIQNFLYDLATIIDGIVIFITEKGGSEAPPLVRELEHVVDAILELRLVMESGMSRRYMRLRKIRGHEIDGADIPFRIVPGKGLKVFNPVEIKPLGLKQVEVFRTSCSEIDAATGGLRRGDLMLIAYPPDWKSLRYVYMPLALMIKSSRLRTCVISFKLPSNEVRSLIARSLMSAGLSEDEADRLIIYSIGINPALSGLDEILQSCTYVVRDYRPDLLVLHGLEVLDLIHGEGSRLPAVLYGIAFSARSSGTSVAALMARLSGTGYESLAALSTLIIRLEYVRTEEGVKPRVYAWGFGREPSELSLESLNTCFEGSS